MVASRGTVERRTLRLSWGAAITIVGTLVGLVVARAVFVAAHRPLSWALASVVAAVLLDPLVDRLATRIRRVPAVLVTFLVLGAVAVGGAYLVFDEVEGAIDRLEMAAPEAAASVEARGDGVGRLARDLELENRVVAAVDSLADRTTSGEDVLRSTAGTAPTYLVCAILTVFLMAFGPRMAGAALAQDPDVDRRARVAALVGPATRRARGAIVATVGWAVLVGVAAAGVAAVLDLPAPTALGFAAAVMALLPYAGVVLGCVPLLLVALGFATGAGTLALAAIVIVVQAVDARYLRPWIAGRSVRVGLLVPWVVAVLGYAVYGIGGAAYAAALAVFALALVDEQAMVEQGVRGEPPQVGRRAALPTRRP